MIAINMEMPDNCTKCPCLNDEYWSCNADWGLTEPSTKHRPKGCPLKEIVRCKDCKYYLESNETCGMVSVRLMFYADGKRWTDNCFCCWGERREE